MSAMVRLEPMFLPPKPEFSPLYHTFCLLGTQPMGTSSQAPEPHAHTLQALLELLPKFPVPRCQIYFCLSPPAEVIPGNGSGLETDDSDPGALPLPPERGG